jgi:ketosteroid isomerase-like protein
MSEQNVEVVRGIYEAWRRGDFSIRAGEGPFDSTFQFTPTATRQSLGGGPWRGDEELREMTRDWFKTWDWVWFEAEEFIDAGDRVVVLATQCSRLGENEMRVPIWHLWTLRAGKAIHWQSFDGRAEVLEAAGLDEG